MVGHAIDAGGNVLFDTTHNPLGRRRDAVAGFDYFLLSHPNAVTDKGALSLFSDIEEGDEVTMMVGSSDNLVQRAAWVADNELEMARLGPDQIAGALVIYCAGCMLTVRDRMTEVSSGLARSLGHKPFLGNFTFGEQGCFVGGTNHHGNLMISVVVFGAKPR
ncbi:MAG: FIST C-terminal domain-containing protein [Pseudomonadota bacterium]|nr:FIST C-terminal domain-containing protein [Pseudomonadota bacterium]